MGADNVSPAGGEVNRLEPNREEIERFVETMFRHADAGSYITLRAFHDDKPWQPRRWLWVRVGEDFKWLVTSAVHLARDCANAPEPVVFCPPIVTFDEYKKATHDNLKNGLVLSVECDSRPNEPLQLLGGVLGPATVIVASGGVWIDPETGEIHDKLHLHWVLCQPTRTPEEHALLKEARRLAQRLASADGSAVPPVHPLRWPGSWHRKGEPRMARILSMDPQREIVLADAVQVLRDKVGALPEAERFASDELEADIQKIASWIDIIPNPDLDWDEWNRVGMALWAATAGSEQGRALWHEWSRKSGKYDETRADDRWQHLHRSPPNRIGAGTLAYMASEHFGAWWLDAADQDEAHVVEDDVNANEQPKPNGAAEPETAKPNGAAEGASEDNIVLDTAPKKWPAPLGKAALHGLAGEIVRAIEPHTEADRAALLLQFLVAFGSIIGRDCYCYIDGARHHGNLFLALIGETAQGRKGTGLRRVLEFFAYLMDPWFFRINRGLSTGEGLIHALRDPISKTNKEGEDEIVDAGELDKRLMVVEQEFSRLLRVMTRPENTLSTILREAWDGDDLGVMTRQNALRATAPHISLVVHTTLIDLHKYLKGSTEAANGFGNRFLFACSRRSKSLPFGGKIDKGVMQRLAGKLKEVVSKAHVDDFTEQSDGEMELDANACACWEQVYEGLTTGRPGVFGDITARGAPLVRRIAMLYTLLDGEKKTAHVHLEAALEVWRYCQDSAAYAFGGSTGSALADAALRVLRRRGHGGITKTDLRMELGNKISADEFNTALELLETYRLAASRREETGGRPKDVWAAL